MHTKRGGAAAKAGHDLELHVTSWEGSLDLDAGTAELSADPSSLRVHKGEGGMQKLGDEDKENIVKTIDDEVLQKRSISFRSSELAAAGANRWRVEGDLTLGEQTEPLTFELVVDGDAVSASATVNQPRWGIKPFSALFGTLKVLDDVEVRIQSR